MELTLRVPRIHSSNNLPYVTSSFFAETQDGNVNKLDGRFYLH